MSAPYFEAYGSGGPSDDAVGVKTWLAFQRCAAVGEAAREARDREPGAVLSVLLTPVQPPARGRR